MQASETGEMINSDRNATEKNVRKRNFRKECVESTMSQSKKNFELSYLQFTVSAKASELERT